MSPGSNEEYPSLRNEHMVDLSQEPVFIPYLVDHIQDQSEVDAGRKVLTSERIPLTDTSVDPFRKTCSGSWISL